MFLQLEGAESLGNAAAAARRGHEALQPAGVVRTVASVDDDDDNDEKKLDVSHSHIHSHSYSHSHSHEPATSALSRLTKYVSE